MIGDTVNDLLKTFGLPFNDDYAETGCLSYGNVEFFTDKSNMTVLNGESVIVGARVKGDTSLNKDISGGMTLEELSEYHRFEDGVPKFYPYDCICAAETHIMVGIRSCLLRVEFSCPFVEGCFNVPCDSILVWAENIL